MKKFVELLENLEQDVTVKTFRNCVKKASASIYYNQR